MTANHPSTKTQALAREIHQLVQQVQAGAELRISRNITATGDITFTFSKDIAKEARMWLEPLALSEYQDLPERLQEKIAEVSLSHESFQTRYERLRQEWHDELMDDTTPWDNIRECLNETEVNPWL